MAVCHYRIRSSLLTKPQAVCKLYEKRRSRDERADRERRFLLSGFQGGWRSGEKVTLSMEFSKDNVWMQVPVCEATESDCGSRLSACSTVLTSKSPEWLCRKSTTSVYRGGAAPQGDKVGVCVQTYILSVHCHVCEPTIPYASQGEDRV